MTKYVQNDYQVHDILFSGWAYVVRIGTHDGLKKTCFPLYYIYTPFLVPTTIYDMFARKRFHMGTWNKTKTGFSCE